MRYMATYDLMETMRNTNQWLGASAKAFASYPGLALSPNPMVQWVAAWGEVTERSFARMVAKPDWGIHSIPSDDGRDHIVSVEPVVERPFGDLIRFHVQGRPEKKRKVMLVAPMSGHYATLLRSTVASLLPDAEVYITDWHNARDIPVSAGKFDIEDYTLYLVDFMRELGPDTNVIAVCQPAPLALAATAYLAAEDPKAQPRTLTLIGGPIDPDAAATDVTDFGRRITMGQLEETAIQRVGFKYKGVGRMVYPGLLQLASFMSMNGERHSKAFQDQILRVTKGEAADHDPHNRFYDEYLAVMDMTAEFYLSTVERIFKGGEIARNAFVVNGKKVDISAITSVAVKTVEGSKDDISAPGQCVAALDLLTGLPDSKKASHLEQGAGHYGIFAGKSWRNNIRPLVLDFIDANAEQPKKAAPEKAKSNVTPIKAELAREKKAPAKTKPKTTAKSQGKSKPRNTGKSA
ncbi:polyhydroxyalkanoate depolymerase [Halocynthiibacter sp. C4]|uniref:polyhydroxyalkanoate depolymerase n=1 Tax=Halocynthiibacter sp. C4 TaxID=2992758 RepID=UPI00237C0398|nr:polyhydroxyalkanoate depolymerase [Halocynthiibacter sp. C4]MDE0590158.1 polyhydroxyalkanoate depolymerase [Halocynthiibacter sp. C4]